MTSSKRIQSDDEIRAIREEIANRSSQYGQGRSWMLIEQLCNTVDELRRLLAGRTR